MSSANAFHAARDLLIRHRLDYARAMTEFRWPELPTFNWAVDHFDGLARGNTRRALWIVEKSGAESHRTFDEMRVASDRAANFLRRLGIKRGDRLLVMLGNRAELWEIMLAAIKLGAVLSPATTILSTADLKDRIERGQMRAVIVDATNTARFTGLADRCLRVSVGGEVAGWTGFAGCSAASATFEPEGITRADDPCMVYFTSGTTAKPKMVLHTQRSYPVGHLSTMYWIGLQPGDVHLNISTPGWAKHAWSCLFAPWTPGGHLKIPHLWPGQNPPPVVRGTVLMFTRLSSAWQCAPRLPSGASSCPRI